MWWGLAWQFRHEPQGRGCQPPGKLLNAVCISSPHRSFFRNNHNPQDISEAENMDADYATTASEKASNSLSDLQSSIGLFLLGSASQYGSSSRPMSAISETFVLLTRAIENRPRNSFVTTFSRR